MDKLKPTYDLESIQSAFSSPDRLIATSTAILGAAEMGLGRQDIIDVIQGLSKSDFYKSITSYRDHKVWQDVYHGKSEAGEVYIKFTADVVTEFLLLLLQGEVI